MRFQRRYWLFERVGWSMLVLLIAAAAAGTFAGGPLSAATATGAALSADYERFARRGVDTRLTVTLPARRSLRIQGAEGFDIAAVEPRPAKERSDRGGLAYDFAAGAGDGATTVTFRLTPRHWGMQHLRLATDDGAPATLDILVYP